jgi:hypothetical protein
MRNIFLLYMPPGNHEAMVHYQDTIRNRVSFERIAPHVGRQLGGDLRQIFGDHPIAVWGSRDSPANRGKFDRMQPGDEVLIVVGPTIKLLGRIAQKVVSPSLSRVLWRNLTGSEAEGWDLVYFIANPQEIDVPFEDFRLLFGYESNFQLRGFTSVAEDRLADFYARYDDLYSILMRKKQHLPIEQRRPGDLTLLPPPKEEGVAEKPPEFAMSEHLEMQWMLLKMGRQAGEKVWAPRGDQSRIKSEYAFDNFEPTFAAGLDAQVKYIENIDVVWKEEFRIDAAFEVENTTSIYSGLLRFSDLTTVAPNTLYPLFIVAPSERKNRVREQVTRPTFKHLRLGEKVRFLPYESVRDIDRFFGESASGLNVDVFVGKSEKLVA